MLLVFFLARPFWIEYQVAQKTEHLNQYLVERYLDEEWSISRQEGRQYSPYHLKVEFKNEKGWVYTYSVVEEESICQNAWSPPEGDPSDEGGAL